MSETAAAVAVAGLVVASLAGTALISVEHIVMAFVGVIAASVLSRRISNLGKRLDELEKGPEPSGSIPFAGKKPAAPPADPSNRPKRKRHS